MRVLIKGVMLWYLIVFITLNMFAGCSFINVYSEIKKDPIVFDVELYQKEDEVTCRVILEIDTYLEDPTLKANQFRKVIRTEFKDAKIFIEFVQNGKVSTID